MPELPDVRHLPLFRDRLQASFEPLMPRTHAQNLPTRLAPIRQGDSADFRHVVIEGLVEIRAERGGRTCTMAMVQPVGSFLLAAGIKDAAYVPKQSRQAGNARSFVLRVEKRLIASCLGMTPENLSQRLRLPEADDISVSGRQVTIADRERLTAVARSDVLIDGPDPVRRRAGTGRPPPNAA